MRLVEGDILVDYKDICDNFINLKMICRLSLSKVLIRVGCVCVRSLGECMSICMSVCVYIAFKEKEKKKEDKEKKLNENPKNR